jgi:hypothetical protein
MGSIDSNFKKEVFRKDHPAIIAQDRQLAVLIGARMKYNATGYLAGTVVARNNVSGLYDKYDNGGASGLDNAVGVLFQDVAEESFESATGSTTAVVIAGGVVYKDKLIGLDAGAEADLGAKTIIGADGVELLKY